VKTMSRDDIERLGDTRIGAQPMTAPGTR
jgi:hypothetical protein